MSTAHVALLARAGDGGRLSDAEVRGLLAVEDEGKLLAAAARARDLGHGPVVTYSPKVFIPLTKLCRDVCHYCTFSRAPRRAQPAFLSPEEVLEIAAAGAAAGCREALFTLGEKPERRYRTAREALGRFGFPSTLAYLHWVAKRVVEETGLLPHINAGTMPGRWMRAFRKVSASQGLMLETVSPRLGARGGPHFGSPDKHPARRLATIHAAGKARVPFTTGLLVGIGETRAEILESLLALRRLDERHGHIQELIIQNFEPKAATPMAAARPAEVRDVVWTIALARLVFGPAMNIQAPPNLNAGRLAALIAAGINDWGGVSPVTVDHVNPEAPWPHLDTLRRETEAAGKLLVPRLTVYPEFARDPARWLDRAMGRPVLAASDAEGYAREDGWEAGRSVAAPPSRSGVGRPLKHAQLTRILDRACAGRRLSEAEVVTLFAARGDAEREVRAAADRLRTETVGRDVTYVVNRNINYTNICRYRCGFCAFSKGHAADGHRDRPYLLDLDEVARRAVEAHARGASEVCMQGGIHPAYTGETYLSLCRAVRRAVPDIHIHAFSPLEVTHGAETLGLSVPEFLAALAEAGLSTLPGTAAEILDDEVRAVICPDKIDTAGWLAVVEAAHRLGLRTTATIMFGHVDQPVHWARHLLRVRDLQERTGGVTEFVPLPFVAGEAPIFRRGLTRPGPTFREAVLMHAVARLALHPLIANIQVSWVKMGPEGVVACLESGSNDLGGTLMNESITRAAGARHGQEMSPAAMARLAAEAGRPLAQRTTVYGRPEVFERPSFQPQPA